MGRRPTPTALAIAMGDPRKIGKRKLLAQLKAEPKGQRGLPPCPKVLTGTARAAWDLIAEELAIMGLDYRSDVILLTGLCLAYQKGMDGNLKAWDLVNRIASNFPLSAVARRRLVATDSAAKPEQDLMTVLATARPTREKRVESVQ